MHQACARWPGYKDEDELVFLLSYVNSVSEMDACVQPAGCQLHPQLPSLTWHGFHAAFCEQEPSLSML